MRLIELFNYFVSINFDLYLKVRFNLALDENGDKRVSEKLKDYFRNNIKLSLINRSKLLIITKNDLFYETNIEDSKLSSFILGNDTQN